MTIIEYIGSIGGIAGVLAFLIFLAYRHLVNQMREDRKFMEDRLTKIIEAEQSSRERNTIALTELVSWLKKENGKRIRR